MRADEAIREIEGESGATVYFCPVDECHYTLEVPEGALGSLPRQVESQLGRHLQAHGPVAYMRTIQRLNSELTKANRLRADATMSATQRLAEVLGLRQQIDESKIVNETIAIWDYELEPNGYVCFKCGEPVDTTPCPAHGEGQ